MFGGKLKIDKDLLARAEKAALKAGYSSVSEFVTHVIERELAQLEDSSDEAETRNRLKGLGYIS